jgi:lipoprotein-anchoring transpeptidase ErfK/SrfK
MDTLSVTHSITRRDFLKVLGLSSLSTAFASFPIEPFSPAVGLGRIAVSSVYVYSEPSFRARRLGYHVRDELISLLEEISSEEGPFHNPTWYKTPHGYAHSGNLQIVRWQPQSPEMYISEQGALFEISIPYTRTYRNPDPSSSPLFRLYYKSTAWVKSVVKGEDGRRWYSVLDDVTGIQYYARAEHLRKITEEEISPLSVDVPWSEKRIEVDLKNQMLRAYEFDRTVLETKISSGIPDRTPRYNGIPTVTPSGRFNISRKMPFRHMGDGNLTPDLNAYELPGVPWVCFFHITGVAVHGTYWHSDFGRPRSHGCVNVPTETAQWLYRWSSPVVPPDEWMISGYGTPVIVR